MKKMLLSEDARIFFKKQFFVTLNTIDDNGYPHSSCKGLIKVEGDSFYLLDLYKLQTYHNLKKRKKAGVTAVDPVLFKGYTVKGPARIVKITEAHSDLINMGRENIIKRMSHRVVSHVKKENSSLYHPELRMPHPEYIIIVQAKKVVDLVPALIQG